MCDGNLREKLGIIKDLVRIDHPAEPDEYIQEHLTWSIAKLKKYRAGIDPGSEEEKLSASDC